MKEITILLSIVHNLNIWNGKNNILMGTANAMSIVTHKYQLVCR